MEMLKRAWLVVRRRWPALLIPIVVALVGVSIYNAQQRKDYTATIDLFLRAPDVKSSASAYQGDLFSRQRAQSYVKMFESDDLAQSVIDRLNLSETPSELTDHVSAAIVKDTVLITVSVEDPNPQQAANIANAYGDVFGEYVAKVENVQNDPGVPPLVLVVRAANADDAQRGGYKLWMLATAGGVGGLVIGLLLVWFFERYDNKVRSRKQIDELTGRPVIGSLPITRALDTATVAQTYDESAEFAEAARRLSINVDHLLRQLGGVSGAPAMAVTSVQGADGKSVVAAALTKALADRGHDVGFIDADRLGKPGLDSSAMAGGELDVAGVTYVPLRDDNQAFTERGLRRAINDLKQRVDFIIIDGPAFGEAAEAQMIAEVADAVLIVVRPGRTTGAALGNMHTAMATLDTPVIGVVVNQAKETATRETMYV
ncbi:hypothetical protein LV457_04970 [Mycobacterium sp. MYCO198283]|uniref:division plane positioning ATPase MipZ n=1 Tax=Mycobacterium sp. MYCO198283 TaxID=2883505 RepID=UPI001E3C527B|nr:division plane positioning ATPase MipZ [Mycobacterium sp. MYCO198283]MCG5431643.1 hypothetical protein [Mycobacterium sp. MYCO198283]